MPFSQVCLLACLLGPIGEFVVGNVKMGCMLTVSVIGT